jgi:hypothetical protein
MLGSLEDEEQADSANAAAKTAADAVHDRVVVDDLSGVFIVILLSVLLDWR